MKQNIQALSKYKKVSQVSKQSDLVRKIFILIFTLNVSPKYNRFCRKHFESTLGDMRTASKKISFRLIET